MFTCTYFSEYVVLISCCCYRRAPTGRYSCKVQGASPGLIIVTHLLSPFRGGTSAWVLGVVVMLYCIYPLGHLLAWVSVAPTELNSLLSACSQGFISGFVLISPWAMQEYRAYGTHNTPECWCGCPGQYKLCMNLLIKKLYLCRKFKRDNTSSVIGC